MGDPLRTEITYTIRSNRVINRANGRNCRRASFEDTVRRLSLSAIPPAPCGRESECLADLEGLKDDVIPLNLRPGKGIPVVEVRFRCADDGDRDECARSLNLITAQVAQGLWREEGLEMIAHGLFETAVHGASGFISPSDHHGLLQHIIDAETDIA